MKLLRLYRGWDSVSQLAMVFWAEAGSGEYTQSCTVDRATFLAQGEWLACGVDDALPRKTRAVYLALGESGTYTYNITTGEGGAAGEPATLDATVRVDRAAANREVVMLERPSDGQWRVAGWGVTPDGEGELQLRVTDGLCYAVALDDWGLAFQAGLTVSVGQTIRPTVFSGWLYRVTQAGALPAEEPDWWPIEGDNAPRNVGTARAVAVRYYRPLAHGPLPVEMS